MGDYMDAVLRTDLKRFSGNCTKEDLMDMLDSAINEQRDLVIRKFGRLSDAGRLLGMLEGNHEETIKKHHQFDVMKDITERLKVPNLGYSCFFRLALVKATKKGTTRNVLIYAHHGHGSSRRTGGSVNRFDDVVKNNEADIYLMGHDHKKWGKREIRLYLNKANQLAYKPIILGRTGSFMKTAVSGLTTYSEKANYPAVDLGVIKITINLKHTQNNKISDRHELDMHISE